MICLAVTHENIELEAEVLAEGIIHCRAAGLDGYAESLLERYGFIDRLPGDAGAVSEGNILKFGDGYEFQIAEDLSFSLVRNGKLLFRTMDGYNPGKGITARKNSGYCLCTSLEENEKFIGFGDQNRKSFLLNGQKESLWLRNQSDYIPVPFFMSSRGYGILFNTTRRLYYDFGVTQKDACRFSVAREYLSIYIFTGDNYNELIRKYTALTGRPQLVPRYTFGLWMVMHTECRAHEVLQIAREMRREQIPCDILALEPLWMDKLYDASLDKKWSEERFPYFPWAKKEDTMIGCLKSMGYHFGLWMPSEYDHTYEEERRLTGKTPAVYDLNEEFTAGNDLQVVEADEHFGHNPLLLDKVTRPEEDFFEHLKKFVDQGVDYFKQDGYALINLHPDRLYGNQQTDEVMHNIHYMIHTRQMHRHMESYTGRRAFTFAVAGWAGFQHFSGTWAGDTGGGGQSLCAVLQLAVVGHSFATCDMETDCPEGIHLGFLLPWSQLCSWSYYKYPVYKSEKLKGIIRDYANLRMRLQPFLYSLAYRAAQSGRAIARPLFLEYPEIEAAYHLAHEFMLGEAFLAGIYTKSLTLPSGRWLDYWTGEIVEGDWMEKEYGYADDKGGQLFLKEGAIVPLFPVQQFSDELQPDRITWQIFPGPESSRFTLYLDDGISLDYRNGKFALAALNCKSDKDEILIFWDEITGSEPERISELNYDYEIRDVDSADKVTVNGKEYPSEFSEEQRLLKIKNLPYKAEITIYTQLG